MLAMCAAGAGIKVPADLENYSSEEFPHFYVYTQMQLGRRMPSPTSHWENAEVVALVPDDRIQLITRDAPLGMGFQ